MPPRRKYVKRKVGGSLKSAAITAGKIGAALAGMLIAGSLLKSDVPDPPASLDFSPRFKARMGEGKRKRVKRL